ncbi:MAG: putative porin, partial [Candidatus Binatia bacterium]
IVGGDPFDPGDLEVEDGDPLEIVGYASDFNVFDVGSDVSIATGMPAWPLKVFGHYLVNTEADDDDTGFQFGAGIGNSKDPGDINFTYAYQRLETDAVLSTFSDSDFGFDGGTNREGHILQLSYMFMKNLQFVSTAWFVEPIDGGNDNLQKRWQVDMIAKF